MMVERPPVDEGLRELRALHDAVHTAVAWDACESCRTIRGDGDHDHHHDPRCETCKYLASPAASPEGLDIERLAEAVFRVGSGHRDPATASIVARIGNSQDGAKAAGQFAALVAAEYAHLSDTGERP